MWGRLPLIIKTVESDDRCSQEFIFFKIFRKDGMTLPVPDMTTTAKLF